MKEKTGGFRVEYRFCIKICGRGDKVCVTVWQCVSYWKTTHEHINWKKRRNWHHLRSWTQHNTTQHFPLEVEEIYCLTRSCGFKRSALFGVLVRNSYQKKIEEVKVFIRFLRVRCVRYECQSIIILKAWKGVRNGLSLKNFV